MSEPPQPAGPAVPAPHSAIAMVPPLARAGRSGDTDTDTGKDADSDTALHAPLDNVSPTTAARLELASSTTHPPSPVPPEKVKEDTPTRLRKIAQPAKRFVSLAGMGLVFDASAATSTSTSTSTSIPSASTSTPSAAPIPISTIINSNESIKSNASVAGSVGPDTPERGPRPRSVTPTSTEGSPRTSTSSLSSMFDPPSPQPKIMRTGPKDGDLDDLGGFGWAPKKYGFLPGPAVDFSPSRRRSSSSSYGSISNNYSPSSSPGGAPVATPFWENNNQASPGAMRRAQSYPTQVAPYHPSDASPARRLFVPTAIDPYSVPPSSFQTSGTALLSLQNQASESDLILPATSPRTIEGTAGGDFEAWLSDTDSLRSASSLSSGSSGPFPAFIPSDRPTAPSPGHAAPSNMIIERRGLNDREESEQAREERLIRARGMQKSRSADGVQMLVRLIEPRELDRRESLGMIENMPLAALLPVFRPSHYQEEREERRGRSPTRYPPGPDLASDLNLPRTETPSDSTGTPELAHADLHPDIAGAQPSGTATDLDRKRGLPTGMLGPSPSPTPPVHGTGSDKDSEGTAVGGEEVQIEEIDVPLKKNAGSGKVISLGPPPVGSSSTQLEQTSPRLKPTIQPKSISIAPGSPQPSIPKPQPVSPAAPKPVLATTVVQPKSILRPASAIATTSVAAKVTAEPADDESAATRELFRILSKKKPAVKVPPPPPKPSSPSKPASPAQQQQQPDVPLPPLSPAPTKAQHQPFPKASDSFSLTSDSESEEDEIDDPRGGRGIGSPFSLPPSDSTSDTQSDADEDSPLMKSKWIGVTIGASPVQIGDSSMLKGLDLGSTGARLPAAQASRSGMGSGNSVDRGLGLSHPVPASGGLKRVTSSKRLSDERFKDEQGGVIGSPLEKAEHSFSGPPGISRSGDVAGARHRRNSLDDRVIGGRATSAGSSSSGSSFSSDTDEDGSVFEEELTTYDVRLPSARHLPHSLSAPSLLQKTPEQRRGLLNLSSTHPNAGLFDHLPTLRSGKLVRPALRSSRHSTHYKKSLRFSDTSLKSVVLFEKHDVPYAVIAAPRYTAPDNDSLPAGFAPQKFRYDLIMRSEHVPEQGELTAPEHMVVLRSLRRMDEGIMFGEVHVRNLSFNKRVSVRYTLDFWQSYDDLTCHYLSPLESSYGIDRFGFHLDISETFRRVYERDPEASTKLVRLTMIFGVRYIAEGCGEWWDNNWGMNYEVELTRAPDILGSGVGIPGIEPNSTAPGPMTSRGPPSALFSSATWLQPGTITPLWLTQPGLGLDSPRDSPSKSFWPQTSGFGVGPMWGPGMGIGGMGGGQPEPEADEVIGEAPEAADPAVPSPSQLVESGSGSAGLEGKASRGGKAPVYSSIFFDTSMLPHVDAIPVLSPVLETPRSAESPLLTPSSLSKPSPFFADFTFETHLPPASKPDWYTKAPDGTYSSLPTSQTDLNESVNLGSLALSASAASKASSSSASERHQGSPTRSARRTSITPGGSPSRGSPASHAAVEHIYQQKLREQGSWEDYRGDWANSRRRNMFGGTEEKDKDEKEKKAFRTEVVDVGEYTRTGGRAAYLAGRKG